MKNPWKTQTKKPIFILAPMEAVTDTVFRHVVKQAAAPDIFLPNLLVPTVMPARRADIALKVDYYSLTMNSQ